MSTIFANFLLFKHRQCAHLRNNNNNLIKKWIVFCRSFLVIRCARAVLLVCCHVSPHHCRSLVHLLRCHSPPLAIRRKSARKRRQWRRWFAKNVANRCWAEVFNITLIDFYCFQLKSEAFNRLKMPFEALS